MPDPSEWYETGSSLRSQLDELRRATGATGGAMRNFMRAMSEINDEGILSVPRPEVRQFVPGEYVIQEQPG